MNYGRAKVLTKLALERQWKCGAELGLWDGRTFFYLLDHVPSLRMIGVDVFRDIGLELYAEPAWNHQGYYRAVCRGVGAYQDRALIIRGLTIKAAEFVKDHSLDFVFIDADHSTEGVTADIQAWLCKVKRGGMVAGHDIDWPSVKAVVETNFYNYQTHNDNVWTASVL